MNRLIRLLALVALAFGSAACSDIFRSSYDYGRVVVTAIDQDGQPVPEVRLTLYVGAMHMGYGETGADGVHEFAFVPRGDYGVEAGAPAGFHWPAGAVPYRIIHVDMGGRATADFTFVNQN